MKCHDFEHQIELIEQALPVRESWHSANNFEILKINGAVNPLILTHHPLFGGKYFNGAVNFFFLTVILRRPNISKNDSADEKKMMSKTNKRGGDEQTTRQMTCASAEMLSVGEA